MDNILNMMQAQFECTSEICWHYRSMNASGLFVCAHLFLSLNAFARFAKTIGQAAKLQYVFGQVYMGAMQLASLDDSLNMLRF